MPDARLKVVALHMRPQAGAQIMRRCGLTDGTDIVPFALNCQ
jgi:hypothetical protein